MKAKYISTLVIISIMVVCLVGIVSFTKGSNTNDEFEMPEEVNNNITQIRSQVMSDNITSTVTMDGEVCSGIYGESDKYIDVTFDKKKSYDSFYLKYKIGQDLKKGDTLYHVGGKEYKSEYNGRIVSQEITKEYAHITIMDYDSIVIAASLDLEKLQQIKIGKKVTIQLQSEKGKNKKIKSKIVGIGSTVEDGKVDIYISNKGKLLLGTKMKVSYTNKKKAKSLYILKKMLINDGDVYYVNVLEGNKTKSIEVKIGEEFQLEEEGQKIEYIEILEGLSGNETLVLEEVMEK
ncbi:MAG: HlyD family efflux transporter periplasmic adaptor subunit [Lachnospiraceae bacterium]|nr:HlyD family efflux transporter periplasmic adaptor subunit [Lachnospiraceae bacterium]